MCIMEVRAGQRASTIAQACAHNTTTVERDLDMFIHLMEHRDSNPELLHALKFEQKNLQRAYAGLVEVFGELAHKEEEQHGLHFTAHHPPGHDHTNEREEGRVSEESFIHTAHHDATLARRFETR